MSQCAELASRMGAQTVRIARIFQEGEGRLMERSWQVC